MSYNFDAGTTDETVTAPSAVKCYRCTGGPSGGTIIVTPKGQSALPTIHVSAGQPFEEILTTFPDDLDALNELPKDSTIAFAGMANWFVRFAS